jgi:hypothetical protein
MSLIPSESAHFPDLIGQHHGYRNPNARRPSLKRKQTEAAPSPASTAVPKRPEEDGDGLKSQNEVSPTAGPPSKTVEQLELVPQNAPAERDSRHEQKGNIPVDVTADVTQTSRPLSSALPIPPQRSIALMRSKVQPQEIATPRPTARPRTPTRGLVVAHPTPVIRGKPPSQPSLAPRSRVKLVRFIACEIIAIGVLIFAMKFGFSHRSTDDFASVFFKILAITAAVGAAIVPEIFFGLPVILPRSNTE